MQWRNGVAGFQKAGAGSARIQAGPAICRATFGEPVAAAWMSVPGQHVKRICWLQVDSRTFDAGPVRTPPPEHLNVLMHCAAF